MCQMHTPNKGSRLKKEREIGEKTIDTHYHTLPREQAVQISTSLCVSLLAVKAKRKAGK